MKEELIERLIEVIREANLSPIQRASCLTCDLCDVENPSLKGYCRHHKKYIYNGFKGVQEGICFEYRPLMEKE